MVEYLETVPEKTMEEKEEELKLSLPQATDSRKKHLSQDSAGKDQPCIISQITNTATLAESGNTKGGSFTVPLPSCLTGLESAV
jgi:hypothetical protein